MRKPKDTIQSPIGPMNFSPKSGSRNIIPIIKKVHPMSLSILFGEEFYEYIQS